MEGLDFLGADAVGHGHGGHGGHHRGGRGFRGGAPWNWGWGGPNVVFVEDEPFDEAEAYRRWVLLGDDGYVAELRAVQTALKAAGFDPGAIDGAWGPKTAAAVTAFWGSRGQSHTSVVDDELLAALGLRKAPPTDGRPAKGWSQPQPGAMGPAITPESQAADAAKKKWLIVIGGGVAVAIGVALFAFSGRS